MLGIKRDSQIIREGVSTGTFVKNFIEPGVREISIMDFKIFKSDGGLLWISALCEESTDEDLGDKARKYKGLMGDHVAKGKFGEISIIPIALSSPDKGSAILTNDTGSIATVVGRLAEAEAISFAQPEDTEQLVINYLKALLPVIKGIKFVTIIKGKQNGKYDNLEFNRGYISQENLKKRNIPIPAWLEADKSLPTAISSYSVNDVEEIKRDENGDNITHELYIKGEEKPHKFVKLSGEDTWYYKWQVTASPEEGKTPASDIPEISGLGMPSGDASDDLPF